MGVWRSSAYCLVCCCLCLLEVFEFEVEVVGGEEALVVLALGVAAGGEDGFPHAFVASGGGLVDGGPAAVVGDVGVRAFFEHPDGLLHLAPTDEFVEDGTRLIEAVIQIGAVVESGFGEVHGFAPGGGGERLGWVCAAIEEEFEQFEMATVGGEVGDVELVAPTFG